MIAEDQVETSDENRSGNTTQIYGVVLGVGVMCSLAIVTVYEVTGPIIQRNRVALRTEGILTVLPEAKSVAAFELSDPSGELIPTDVVTEGGNFVFAGFSAQDELVGVAIQTNGMGYAGLIGVIYGYSFDEQAIIGMQVLQSSETPGLGDRIKTDARFTSNFDRLDVSLNSDGNELAHPIEFVKPLEKEHPWQIDGITGATISSRAIAEMLRDSTIRWIPQVHRQRSQFVRPSEQE